MTSIRLPLVLLAALVPSSVHAQSNRGLRLEPAVPTITVAASTAILVVPDEVMVRFSVEDRSPKLADAVKACDTSTAAVLDFLKQSGIAAKDVDSDFIEIVPDFNGPRGEDLLEPRFFDVRRGFALRLREVAKFDALLTGMLEAGVDRVQEVEFRTTALRKHRDQARLQAVRAAREKAVALAGELGAKVGKPFSIEETPGGGVRGHGGRRGQAHSQINIEADAPGDATDGDAEQKLAAGMISVTSRVDVVFTLE
jgi:uncharacterized protein YggE